MSGVSCYYFQTAPKFDQVRETAANSTITKRWFFLFFPSGMSARSPTTGYNAVRIWKNKWLIYWLIGLMALAGTGWHCLTNDFWYLQNEKGNAMRQGMRIRKVNYCMHIFALSRADPPSVAQCFATRLRHSRFHLRSLLHTFDALHAVQIVNCALLMVAQNLASPCGSIRIQRNCMVNMRLPSHH